MVIRYVGVRTYAGFYFGGTSLLIVVGVAMDTVNQIESQLIMRHYDGFSPRSGRIRGRKTW
jgi:preprotein translocase subunit SecY